MESYSVMAGTIGELWRYPVKSMAGESLEQAEVTGTGLAGDRRHALIDTAGNRAGEPLTGRQLPGLLAYRAQLVDDALAVVAPDGRRIDLAAARAEIAALTGRPLELGQRPQAHHDDSPVLLVNLATVRRLETDHGAPLDRRRFRANAYVDGLAADAELDWPGRRLSFGTAELVAEKLCARCVMVTIDPDDLSCDPRLLRTLSRTRGTLLGVYCRVTSPGWVSVGDLVAPI